MNRIGRQLFVLGSNRGILGQERVLRGNIVQTCHISTLDSMYEKMISLPAVHYIEDSLVQFHDVTGSILINIKLYLLVQGRYGKNKRVEDKLKLNYE